MKERRRGRQTGGKREEKSRVREGGRGNYQTSLPVCFH